MSATVCFCHGRESGPWGTKIRRLATVAEQHGCRVVSCDDRDTQDPELRVSRLLAAAPQLGQPLILVGSSMGGYVAAAAAASLRPAGLFLLAPAVGLPGYRLAAPEPSAGRTVIVHGWGDTIVPADNVIAFARQCRATLHLLDDNHLLQGELAAMARLFGEFLATLLERPDREAARELVAAL